MPANEYGAASPRVCGGVGEEGAGLALPRREPPTKKEVPFSGSRYMER